METKIKLLCDKISAEQLYRLQKTDLACACNINNSKAHYHIAKKYTRIDIGSSGRYMLDNSTGEIFGIKAYGVINRKHFFGTIDTIDKYFWGNYKAVLLRI